MEERRTSPRGEWLELVGDGALTTAGTMGLLTGIVLLVTGVIVRGGVPVWMEAGSGILVLLGYAAGPVVAWLVRGRKITLAAAGGALVSAPVTAALFFAFVLLSTALGWLLQGINDAEWFGPLVGAALVEIGFLGLCVWLVADAVRDRAPSRRQHVRVDAVRLAAFAIVIVYSVVVVIFALQPGAGEVFEALGFMLIGAVAGGCAVAFAGLAERLFTPEKPVSEG